MAVKAPSSGGNLCEIFALNLSGSTLACAKSDFQFSFDKTVSSKVTGHPLKQSVKIELENKEFSEAYETFCKSYLTNVAVEQVKVTYEDNSEDTLVTQPANSKTFGVIYYTGTSGTKRAVYMGRGVLSGATGDASFVSKNLGAYPVEITLLSGTGVSFASDCFGTTNALLKVSGATAKNITDAEFGHTAWLTSV